MEGGNLAIGSAAWIDADLLDRKKAAATPHRR
jgi:hypothetical protein